MSHALHSGLLVAVMAGVTVLLRFVPFLLFPEGKPTPHWVAYLSETLPNAIIGILIIYCLKETSLTSWPHGIPEAIAIALVAFLQWWRKNTLLSILAGTAGYMLMVQVIF